ncbi:MAG: hypothetical protein QXM96_03960 [Candidatus Woesearchaeota archaeon]
MIKKLKHKITKRQSNLISFLKNNSDNLSLKKQHQLYGSIKELENIKNYLEKIEKDINKN